MVTRDGKDNYDVLQAAVFKETFLNTNGWNLKRHQLLVFGDLWALWCCWCKVSMDLVTGCKTLRQLHYLNHQTASACEKRL